MAATAPASCNLATYLAGQVIMLDPSGPLNAAIGAGNLRAFVDGTDSAGRAALGN
jgi:hypothetical protein